MRPVAVHKAVRRAWRKQFGLGTVGGGGSILSPVVVVTSPLARALTAAAAGSRDATRRS